MQLLSASRAAQDPRVPFTAHALRAAARAVPPRLPSLNVRGHLLFDLNSLIAAIAALPRCPYEDAAGNVCAQPAIGASGACGRHAAAVASKGVKRPASVGHKISVAKLGHPVSLETRAKLANAHRKYPA